MRFAAVPASCAVAQVRKRVDGRADRANGGLATGFIINAIEADGIENLIAKVEIPGGQSYYNLVRKWEIGLAKPTIKRSRWAGVWRHLVVRAASLCP